MLHNGHLDASKAMYDGMISKIIKHINDDVQTITTHIIQGWIREVNWNFDKASRGEQLGEFYTWYSVVYEIDFVKLWIWVPKHEIVHNM